MITMIKHTTQKLKAMIESAKTVNCKYHKSKLYDYDRRCLPCLPLWLYYIHLYSKMQSVVCDGVGGKSRECVYLCVTISLAQEDQLYTGLLGNKSCCIYTTDWKVHDLYKLQQWVWVETKANLMMLAQLYEISLKAKWLLLKIDDTRSLLKALCCLHGRVCQIWYIRNRLTTSQMYERLTSKQVADTVSRMSSQVVQSICNYPAEQMKTKQLESNYLVHL